LAGNDGDRGTTLLASEALSYWVVTVMEEFAVSWSIRVPVKFPGEDDFFSVLCAVPHSKIPE
jgi:hypothetical protein